LQLFRDVYESQTDTVSLDPGDPAFMHNRGIVCHHQPKALRDEGNVLDIDRRALVRDYFERRSASRNPPDET
jgi:hypothetical protein